MSGHLSPPTRGLQRAPRPLQGRRVEVTLLVKERAETKTLRLLVSSWVIFSAPPPAFYKCFLFLFLSLFLPPLSVRSLTSPLPPILLPHIPALPPFSQPAESLLLARYSWGLFTQPRLQTATRGHFRGRSYRSGDGRARRQDPGGALVSRAPASDGLCPHSPCPCLGGTCPSQQDLGGPFGAWARKGHLKVESGQGQLASRQHL